VDEAIKIMEKYESIDYAKQYAKNMVKESWREIERLLPASKSKERLNAFASFLIERKI
jgi:geranylgeranyl pyrophosphate synthase